MSVSVYAGKAFLEQHTLSKEIARWRMSLYNVISYCMCEVRLYVLYS